MSKKHKKFEKNVDYSIKPGPDLLRFRLGLVRLVTRSIKARFGQVSDQVSQVKDQVGQGQGQELDNIFGTIFKSVNALASQWGIIPD